MKILFQEASVAIIKRYYVIQSKDGYFKPDNWSGEYPEFIDDFEN